MAQQFTNNARALLTSSITLDATSLVIESTKADLFPVANVGAGSIPSANSWFKVTLQDSSGNVEIVAVRTRTAGSGVLSNVIRGYDGTTARAFTAGTVVGLRITAEDVQTALDLPNQNIVFTGDNSFTGINEFTQGLTGDVTGDLTGNVTGNVTGNLTGNVTGNVVGSLSGGSVTNITDLAVADGGTGASDAAGARTNLGLVIGTNVLAPNGSGAALTGLNASALSTGTVPATRSGSLRLVPRVPVYGTTTPNGATITVPMSTGMFEGNTPSFVMFSASALATGITDLRYFRMCSGTTDNVANIVLGSASDDTDQSGTAQGCAASTFVLPYDPNQQFYCLLYGATLFVYIVGYQV